MLLNRSVLLVTVVLLALNLGLFTVFFVGPSDFSAYRTMVIDRDMLFDQLETGGITIDQISEEMAQLGIIQQFCTCQNMKQNYPDIYKVSYAQTEQVIREEYPDMAAAFDAGEYDQQKVNKRISTLAEVLSSVGYTTEFYGKLDEVFENAEKLSNISIFQNNGTQDSNLPKTADDYRRLADIQLTAGNDAPINALISYGTPGFFCVLFACVIVSQTLAENQYNLRSLIYASKNGRGRLTLWRGLGLLIGSGFFGLLLYGSTIAFSCLLLGSVDPERMAQSVPILFGLTVPMTIGELLVTYLLCGIMVQVMLSGLVWLIFSLLEQRQMALLAVASIVGVSVLLYRVIPAQSFLVVLKYANIASVMQFAEGITNYRNLGVGAFLLEKNWVILMAAVMVTVTSTMGAIWCGINRYSISSHGKLYNLIHRWLKKLSEWYYSLVSRLPFAALEGYKVLVMQRGLIVILLLALICVQCYPVRDITYVGESQFMIGVYDKFSGEAITPELEKYVEQLRKKLEDVETEFLLSQRAFENGEIGVEEYLTQSQKYGAYDVQRAALETIQNKMAYIHNQQSKGYEAVILDSTAYDKLLDTSRAMDRFAILIGLFGVIVLSASSFPVEKKRGLKQMIRSTRKGRAHLANKKLWLALCLSLAVFIMLLGIRTYSIVATYGISELTAPAHSLTQFAASSMNLSILAMLLIYWTSQWSVFAIVAVSTCLITQVLSREMSILIGSAIWIGTAVLNLFGFPAVTVWDVLDAATAVVFADSRNGLACSVIILACTWLATVCLWSNIRRARE